MTQNLSEEPQTLQANYKIEAFKTELSYLKDAAQVTLAAMLIDKLPPYFFKVAASSTGKYHPAYTTGEGGLLRHTKAAIRIAHELMRLEMYQQINQYHDAILIALMLHDGWKHGAADEDGNETSQYTVAEHPKVCSAWLLELAETSAFAHYKEELKFIADLVLTHMGQWNENPRAGSIFAPKPSNMWQMFVHLCDYLASRKCIELNFDIPFIDKY